MTEHEKDFSRRFTLGHGAVRGEYVRLDESWRALLGKRAYPAPVVSLLGECLAASALFTSTLKMLQADGRLTLQLQGGYPVSLLIAECRADLTLRAMARVDPAADIGADPSFRTLTNGASFAVTIEPGGDYESYQSHVPLEANSLVETLDTYMKQSEQIETKFALAANHEIAAGMIVQKVSSLGGKSGAEIDPDLWNRVEVFTASVTRDELLELGGEQILHRLFHDEEIRVLPPRPIRFACRCSKERILGVLKVLGREEVQGLLADRRTIDVDCDFCGDHFVFSAEETWAALAQQD